MAVDHIRYDLLVHEALRGMVRNVLMDAAKRGLIGDHHFFITFDTNAPGVQISDALRNRFPQEMTIVLQHQFWDLEVTDDTLQVGLSFNGVAERLKVPFAAIKSFADPSVQFALQFETVTEAIDTATEATNGTPEKSQQRSTRGTRTSVPTTPRSSVKPADPAAEPPVSSDDNKAGAEVVRLDRFRKK
jgi:uncharacterized protein